MKISIDKNRFQLFLWLGAAYYLLWLFIDLSMNPETFLERAWNHVWFICYVIVINFIFFEYSLPSIKLSWKRILAGMFFIWVHLMLCSFGLYAWRSFGIGLHLYFPLITHASVIKGVTYHVPYSIFSGFFFGILIHVYDYRKLKEAAQQLRIEKQQAELNYLKSQTRGCPRVS